MWHRTRRGFLYGVLVVAAIAAMAPTASASITPTLKLDQSAGTAAGSTADLGVDLKFAPTGTDSPNAMTLSLPPGLLADASINGGGCLVTADLNDSNCEVGSGTVTANAYGTIPITTPVTFDLVPPPAAGDLAGLAVNSSGTQVGTTADIKVRPSGDPAGVGITIQFTLPNNLYGVPISIVEIKSTFNGLRYPTTCPATPQSFSVAVNSYSDSTVRTVSAPLSVTRCSALSYSPAFAVTAVRDSSDNKVKLTTQVTQAATEAPSRSVSLAFPYPVVGPNLAAVGVLCPNLSSGTCKPVGSVTAASPLYPRPLTGQAYLTGSLNGPSLTLVFPSPFPLTLVGAVNLGTNSTVFNGLPDIPLTNLEVSLNGGPQALFVANCRPPSGTATAVLTNQNGDRTVTLPEKFTISGCSAVSGAGGSGGNGGSGNGSSGSGGTAGRPKLSHLTLSGLRTGHASLSFRVAAAQGAAKLHALTVVLPGGLTFVRHRLGGRLTVTGVRVIGAQVKSLSLSHGRLVIVLRSAVPALTVKIGSGALQESGGLRAKAKARRLGNLFLTVTTQSTDGKRTAIRVVIHNPGA